MRRFPNLTKRNTVAYVGSYPPSDSSTAMFTMDLVNATDLFGWQSVVVAVGTRAQAMGTWSDNKVAAAIVPDDPASYATAAEFIKLEGIGITCIHHVEEIYGERAADHLPLFARMLSCPVVVTLHSVNPHPSPAERRCIQELEPCTAAFITMAHAGLGMLEEVYGIPRSKVRYIPHGTPFIDFSSEDALAAKEGLGLSGRTVLTSFGSLDPERGNDDVVAALPEVIREHPEVMYVVLCARRPDTVAGASAAYFERIRQMIKKHRLEEHIRVIFDYLDLRRRIEYLTATDIFINAEYGDPHKTMSASLAYAFAAGNVIISTPTPYAHELLANRRGYLFPFRDSHALARRICAVLDDPEEFHAVRQRAYAYGRGMTWEDVGLKYIELFNEMIQHQYPAKTDERHDLKALRGLPSTMVWEHARAGLHHSEKKDS